MKVRLMTKVSAATLISAIACSIFTGCTEKDLYNPERGKTELKPESEYFDFATTAQVAFDVNYGKIAGGALIEVFTEDPITYQTNNLYSINGEAVFKIFADADGRFTGNVELPKATEKVYIISQSWGAPMYVEADVENGKVVVDMTENNANTRSTAMTRAKSNLTIDLKDRKERVYSIVGWGQSHGEIIDNNDIVTTGNFNDGTLKQLQHTLWKGYDSKPSNLDNRALVSDTKHVNTTIAQAYINNQGQHVTITDAELYLTFLTERAGYLTSIGYYYYKTNEIPNSPDKVDKFIIIPNASIAGDDPYTGWSGSGNKYSRYDAPIQKNTKIQLLYQDENGNVSTKFPAGYTIGYFIIPNGYTPNKGIDNSINYIYSNKEWNKIYAGQQARFISLSTSNGTVVYGVEDGDDTSYEDILFCIDANPNEAIQDPDRPVIDPEEPTVTSSETTYRTYAYEDIWPNGGDYDLNDVIIEHKRAISFNSNNYVLKVEDTFVPVQQSGAATYSNAFAVQYVASQRGSIELPAGAVDETETSSVILFPDAKSVQGNEFTVTRTFADNTLPKKNLESDLNPFIIAQYTAGADNRTEVHLPKKKATGKANAEQIGAEDDAYYINKDGKYPFAIMLPATTGTEGPIRFTPAKETVRIDLEYPDFAKWVESNGATNNDWYLYYQSSKE